MIDGTEVDSSPGTGIVLVPSKLLPGAKRALQLMDDYFRQLDVPIGYYQLDAWWYVVEILMRASNQLVTISKLESHDHVLAQVRNALFVRWPLLRRHGYRRSKMRAYQRLVHQEF